jgi:hypothetical protein
MKTKDTGEAAHLSFAEQRPWMERTGWEETYRTKSRSLLSALTKMPYHLPHQRAHVIGRRGENDLDEDLVSPLEDEQKIATFLKLVDGMMDRCEETARKTSRNVLCWLRSAQALSTYPKPFTLVDKPSSTKKYRILWKRCLALILRAYRMDVEAREKLTGVRFKKRQLRYLDSIWDHAASMATDIVSVEGTGHPDEDEPGDLNDEEDNDSDLEHGDEYEMDDEDPGDEEQHLHGPYEETNEVAEEAQEWEETEEELSAHEGTASLAKGSIEELLELLFGLSLTLCTETLTDGQPSSTILIYFSGILGFSTASGVFLSARSYTPHLSGLI